MNFVALTSFLWISLVLCSSLKSSKSKVSFDSVVHDDGNMLRYFRISNEGGSYTHEGSATENYHQIVTERAQLYALLSELSHAIETLDEKSFAALIKSNEPRIGFCMRFHVFFMILNRFRRVSESIEVEIFIEMMNSLKHVQVDEFPNWIVVEQFSAFQSRIADWIEILGRENERAVRLSDKILDFLTCESEKINPAFPK